MAKRKVKICMNLQCGNRVNAGNVTVCTSCGMELRGGVKFLDDEGIDRILYPEKYEQPMEEAAAALETPIQEPPKEFIVCPSCGEKITYRVGLDFCPACGEYVQDEIPIREAAEPVPVAMVPKTGCVKAITSIDGVYRLELSGEWIKFGRQSTGKEYFIQNNKRKVSREHAIFSKQNGDWYISCCKKEDRNYPGGLENPVYVNQHMLYRDEIYKLQVGDRIALGEMDTSDPAAAFFDVE